MAKQELIEKFKADVAAAQEAAAGALYDGAFAEGVASVPASPAGISPEQEQADIAAALAPVQAQVDSLQAQLAALTAAKSDVEGKLAVDEQVIQGLKGSIDKLQGALDFLKALGL